MKLQLAKLLFLMIVTSCASYKRAPDLWTSADVPDGMADSLNLPSTYEVFRFEVDMLRDALKDVGDNESESLMVQLPDPDNDLGPFKVWQSGVVNKKLAKKYPEMIPYKGFQTSDIATKIRLEVPTTGMQVMVTAEEGTWFISPLDADAGLYMVYKKEDLPGGNDFWEGKIE